MLHEVTMDKVVYEMSDLNETALSIRPGERVLFHAEDCFSNEIKTSGKYTVADFDYSKINPATGPVYVEGAEPGDVLRITIEKIELDSHGVVEVFEGVGVLGDRIQGGHTEIVEIKNDKALFLGMELELTPMIGVIGVAPEKGNSIPCGFPGSHGANLDSLEITEGNVVRLPVFVEGGKLALGDLHALMGNGEVCGSGLEVRGKVTLRVDLEKEVGLEDPYVETKDAYYFFASAEMMEDAVKTAVAHAVDFIVEKKEVPYEKACMLTSIACDLEVCQVVNPLKTMKMKVPKNIL